MSDDDEVHENQQGRELLSFSEDVPEVRRVMYKREDDPDSKEEWFYSILDILGALNISSNPREYWKKMKQRSQTDGFEEALRHVVQLRLKAHDNRFHPTDCASRQTLLLLIQSINSPRVEFIKIWLAKTGEESLEQAEEAETEIKREEAKLRRQGFDEKYIANYLRLKLIRNELTDVWKERGAEDIAFPILTNTMHSGAFGLSIKEHRAYKKLPKKADFRKNLTIGEIGVLAFTEATGIELHETRDSYGFNELHRDAQDAGDAGRQARLIAEKTIGKRIVSPENSLALESKPAKDGKKQMETRQPEQYSLFDDQSH